MESCASAPAGTGPASPSWSSKERNPVVNRASQVRKQLGRFLTADPGRFAGGSALSDPLGLLAVERERLAALRSPQHDGSPAADRSAPASPPG
jgi:hypothetical protein